MPLWGPTKTEASLSCLKHENLDMPEMQKGRETTGCLIAPALILPVVTMNLQKCRYILLAITTGQFAAVSQG